MAAHCMERYGVATPDLQYLQNYFKQFPNTEPPSKGHTETYSTLAHMGTLALVVGDNKTVKRAAKLRKEFVKLQSDPENFFYYKMEKGSLVTETDETMNFGPFGFYLQLAYPAAFLASYYRSTGEEVYLEMAKDMMYLDSCHERVYAMQSIKLAVASTLVPQSTRLMLHSRAP
ncbi:hypothetical protein CAPTEDRAFT_190713 [Capitella teleta]|uniref:Uncharacterized protein n=1 Tax=Capitella teleta TaxID=283909 RepID=R7TS40_CAPTE|nr:hypothetical protein CAPTEDRAFT_190713 [Capitella teleta]|eukprot:ELT96469.1 hypothetical protein CAPTEDRAFT_190713 [Capitella teleta]